MKSVKLVSIIITVILSSSFLYAQEEDLVDSRDGQTYKVVQIGEQVWMARNLNFQSEGSFWYDGKAKYGKRHGRLYTWEDAQKVCPSGWHLPSEKEWAELINELGGTKAAGQELKADGSSGFDVFFSGFKGKDGVFYDLGHDANFWSATSVGAEEAWRCFLDRGYSGIVQDYFNKTGALSVRCLKDK